MKKLFVFGLLLSMFACKGDENETPPATSQIEAQSELTVAAEGEEAAVGYTIKNPVEGAVLSAAADVDWIEILSTDNNIVRLSAAKNDEKTTRTGRVTLKYKGANDFVVTVSQTPLDVDFVISVDEVSAYGAKITYSPIKYNGHYVFFVIEKDTLDPYLTSEENLEAWYAKDLAYLNRLAEQNNVTLGQLILRAPQIFGLNGEPVNISYSTLDINTEYYAYCYGLDGDGNRLTDMCYVEFTTGVAGTVDMTFEAKVENLTANGAHVTITPSINNETYYWVYISDFDFINEAGGSANTVMTLISKNLKETGALEQSLHRGPSEQLINDMWDSTLYHIIVWGLDTMGTPTTEAVEVTSFTTLSKGVTDPCTFDMTVTEVKDVDIRVKIVPSNPETRYYVAFIDEEKCANYNDEQMAQRIINMENSRFEQNAYGPGVNWSNFKDMLTGEQEIWGRADMAWTFDPEHTYRIYAFGIDNDGNRTTGIARIDQKTAPVQASTLTINVEYLPEESSWQNGMFQFTPSNEDEYYLPYLAYKEDIDTYYRNADGSLKTDEIMEEISHAYDGEMNYYTRKGTRKLEFRWSAGMEYILLVCGYAGSNTTDFFEFNVTAPEIPFGKSEAEVTATYELFDGAELAKIDPVKWGEYTEHCTIYIRYTPNDKAVHWYGGVWMPVEIYEHDGGVSYLLTLIQNPYASHVDRKTGQYTGLAFQTTYSLSYVAEGADGNFGEWHYEEITPYRDGVLCNMSEPYDFWSKPATNSQILIVPKR